MRAFIMLLAILLLQGCIATESLQRDTLQSAQLAAQQCSETLTQVNDLITEQQKTTKAIEREAKKSRAALTRPVQREQACPDLRKSLRNKTVVGAVEWAVVDLGSKQLIAKARMDTGASTSSLNATNISEFERNGQRWVRFTLADGTEVSKVLIRYVNVRQASTNKDRRRVVKLGIKLGTISYVGEFTLADRRHLKYEVLIGRNVLRDLMVVDVARLYVLGKKPKEAKKSSKKAPKKAARN